MWRAVQIEYSTWEYFYLKLQGELIGRVFAHFFVVRIKVVQLNRTDKNREPIINKYQKI